MNINIYDLEKNDTEMVSHLAPEEVLDKLKGRSHGALFAVDEDRPVACGLLIYSTRDAGKLDLEWLYVFDSYQGNEIGTALMEEFYNMAMGENRALLRVILPEEMEEDDKANAREFFSDWGFSGHDRLLKSDIGVYNSLFSLNDNEADASFDPFAKSAPDTYRWLKNEYYGDVI